MPQLSNNTMNISKMNIKCLKQELIQRGLPTDGLKPALVERLEQAIQQDEEEDKKSNEAFHSVYARLEPQLKKVTEKVLGRLSVQRLPNVGRLRGVQ